MTQAADQGGTASSTPAVPSTPPAPRAPATSQAASAQDAPATETLRVVAGTDTYTVTLNDGEGETVQITREGAEVPASEVNDILDTAALVGVQLAVGKLPPLNARREYRFNEADPGKPELVADSEDAQA